MTITSEYGYWPYVIGAGLFCFLAVASLSAAAICIVCGAVCRKFELATKHLKIVAGLVTFATLCWLFVLGLAAGFWAIHTAVAAVLSVVVIAVFVPPVVLLAGANARYLLEPELQGFGVSPERAAGTGVTASNIPKKGEGEVDSDLELDLLAPGQSGARSRYTFREAAASTTAMLAVPVSGQNSQQPSGHQTPHTAISPRRDSDESERLVTIGSQPKISPQATLEDLDDLGPEQPDSTAHRSGSTPPAALPAAADASQPFVRRFASMLLHDLKSRPLAHIAAVLGAVAFSTLMIVAFHNSCYCSKPKTLSTWMSRSTSDSKCAADGTVCLTYVMLGETCETLTAVGHYVVADGFVPNLAHAESCRLRRGSSTQCDTAWTTHGGVVRSHADLLEDERYIAHVPLRGLQCGAAYRLRITFSSTETTSVARGAHICTHTTPMRTPAPAGTSGVTAFSFIAGGDYVPGKGGTGRTLLAEGLRQRPNASFAIVGGDLGYANNMRTCYRRIDEMLFEWTEALRRPGDGCIIPLAVAVGNHDAGGYQFLGPDKYATPEERQKSVVFYSRYYPNPSVAVDPSDDVNDWTRTVSTRVIGGLIGLTTLDTGHVHAMDGEQALYARNSLTYHRQHGRTSLVLYHVPTLSSSERSGEGGQKSGQVRDAFMPILDDFDDVVTLVFENHDHNYKRTRRLTRDGLASGAAAANPRLRRRGRGVVYTGDGALGAYDVDNVLDADPQKMVARGSNYILVADVLTNGSVAARSFNPAGGQLDAFTAE